MAVLSLPIRSVENGPSAGQKLVKSGQNLVEIVVENPAGMLECWSITEHQRHAKRQLGSSYQNEQRGSGVNQVYIGCESKTRAARTHGRQAQV